MKIFSAMLLLLASLTLAAPPSTHAAPAEFAAWLAELRSEALAAGISPATLDQALAGVAAPRPRIVELDRNQPEQTEAFSHYVEARAGRRRVAAGRVMLRRFPTWLGRVERRFGVQRRFIVALWGMETHYGRLKGGFPVIQALVTLAWDQRRGDYFRRELLAALQILDSGAVPLARLKGSWAGAMGQCQFMPSSYRDFAVDGDGDGRIDIWHSVPDVLASIANYLAAAGWRDDQTWGRPVRVPPGLDPALAGLDQRRPLSRWQALGVRRSDGRDLPHRDLAASLLLPEGPDGPAYLVYGNFRRLLAWNHANSFAVAVGTLADRLAAEP